MAFNSSPTFVLSSDGSLLDSNKENDFSSNTLSFHASSIQNTSIPLTSPTKRAILQNSASGSPLRGMPTVKKQVTFASSEELISSPYIEPKTPPSASMNPQTPSSPSIHEIGLYKPSEVQPMNRHGRQNSAPVFPVKIDYHDAMIRSLQQKIAEKDCQIAKDQEMKRQTRYENQVLQDRVRDLTSDLSSLKILFRCASATLTAIEEKENLSIRKLHTKERELEDNLERYSEYLKGEKMKNENWRIFSDSHVVELEVDIDRLLPPSTN